MIRLVLTNALLLFALIFVLVLLFQHVQSQFVYVVIAVPVYWMMLRLVRQLAQVGGDS